MFWKLCKFEWINGYRNFALFYAVLMIGALLLGIGTLLPENNSLIVQFFIGISGLLYTSMFIATIVLTSVFIVRNYHQAMFKKDAYLTHTLPVSTKQMMAVKILSAVFWTLMSMLMVMLSLGVFSLANGQWEAAGDFMRISWRFWWAFPHKAEFFLLLAVVMSELLEAIALLYFAVNAAHSGYVQRGRIAVAVIIVVIASILESLLLEWINGYFLLTLFQLPGVATLINTVVFNLIMLMIWYFGSVWLLEHHMEVE